MTTLYYIHAAEPTLAMADAILRVERQSLQDSPYTPEEVQGVMSRPEHRVFVAVAGTGGEVVGFCSCFRTSAQGGGRLEVDMLGVLPEHRRRGLGGRLVAEAVGWAGRQGLRRVRGIVAVDNAASKGAFRRAGLASGDPHSLLVYDVRGSTPVALPARGWRYAASVEGPEGEALSLTVSNEKGRSVAHAECLIVHTLSYTGVWVEEMAAGSSLAVRALARAAAEQAKALGVDEVGRLEAVVPSGTDTEVPEEWLREGYQDAGRYVVFEGGA